MMIRAMVADGVFYTADAATLKDELNRAFREVRVPRRDARVVVAPHGAYEISLPYVAESLSSAAETSPECVVIVAPPSGTGRNVLLPESHAFETPFGAVPVDQTVCTALLDGEIVLADEIAHLQDHSVEVMLPALHHLFGPVPIIPLLVGALPWEALIRVQRVLTDAIGSRSALVVAAANLSGFVSPNEADARARKLIRLLLTGGGSAILSRIDTLENPPRSLPSLVLAHLLAGEDTRPEILSRGTFETDFDGEVGSVVFASVAYLPI
ncbi:MAG: AmmeMemoRadiSam system protein B [Alkalispirochaeta sp.]